MILPPTCATAFRILPLLLLTMLWSSPTLAQQRDPQQSIGHTVLDERLETYRFERFLVGSEKRWRVTLGIPTESAPENGFPAFWMLDANAALMEFDTGLLDSLGEQGVPPVLVFVGYDNDLRIDRRRLQDYTFTARPLEDGEPSPEYPGGGADAFLEVIEGQVRAEIEKRVTTDPAQQTLWGHSLGGLFVLHTLFTRPDAFTTYAPGSPSLWWADGALLGQPQRGFTTRYAGQPVRVLLSLGGSERERDHSHRDLSDPRVQAHVQRISSVAPDAPERLAERLDAMDGITASYREFPGMGHGQTFRASLMDALHQITGVAIIDAPR